MPSHTCMVTSAVFSGDHPGSSVYLNPEGWSPESRLSAPRTEPADLHTWVIMRWQGRIQDFSKGGSNIMASVVARAYAGIWGLSTPAVGSRSKAWSWRNSVITSTNSWRILRPFFNFNQQADIMQIESKPIRPTLKWSYSTSQIIIITIRNPLQGCTRISDYSSLLPLPSNYYLPAPPLKSSGR